MRFKAVALCGILAGASSASASFTITINFTGGLTPSQQAIFTTARTYWQGVLVDYKPGITGISGLTIGASGSAIDGVGGILGQAGPTNGSYRTAADSKTYLLTTAGTMQFDSADLANMEAGGTLGQVILHEMGHVLGFGTLWTYNNVYVDGTGQYTGAAALAAYKIEFNQPAATYVPVELGGAAGTANGHWNEVDGGSGLTGITTGLGQDMRNEAMTGWLNNPTFVSNTTVMSFSDIGYAVPEPSITALVVALSSALAMRRRRAGIEADAA